MKLSSKPISSPSRSDKFPPPLMRFLRTNIGSKSKGRTRSNSTTIFIRKKNTNIETSQEPTSPKVTCMGQVIVTRSTKSKQPNTTRAAASDGAPARCHPCLWMRKNGFEIKPCKCKPFWLKWGLFFCVGRFRRKLNKMKEGSTKTELETEHADKEEEEEQEKSEFEERVINGEDESSNSCTPPKNALLLTRCRSAPYRSSSLASRFWNEEETEEKQGNENENLNERKSVSEEEFKRVSENEEKLVFFKEFEDSLLRERIGSMKKTEKVEGLKKSENVEGDYEAPCPIVLTRCKSGPARIGFKFDSEVNNFLKKRKLGLADTID